MLKSFYLAGNHKIVGSFNEAKVSILGSKMITKWYIVDDSNNFVL